LKNRFHLTLAFILATLPATNLIAQTITPPAAATQEKSVLPPTQEAIKAWGFDKSDIKPDASVRFGVLPNGMKYAIMRNATPQHSASIRLRFDVGSTAEADDQQGLAHFLEHMAFNGSKKIPEGEMVKLLERFGLAFGADTNASTGFTETIYKLDLPQVNDAIVDATLMIMRETASELLIDKAAVDRERGVIIGETRARDNFGLRRLKDQIDFMAPGTPVAQRFPIGKESVILNAPVERLRDLYDRFYTPERATLVFVGDVDPAAIEAKILAKFSDWRGKKRHDGDPALGKIDPARPFSVRAFIDPDVPTAVGIAVVKPLISEPDTAKNRQKNLIEQLGNAMLNRRLATLTRNADAPFTGAAVSTGDFFATAETAQFQITAKDRDWKRALKAGEQELRRAITHGFSAAELKEQLANVRTSYKNAADQASSRQSSWLVNGIVGTVEAESIFSTPKDGLARFEGYADSITVDQVNAAFRAAWAGAQPLIHLSHNTPIPEADKVITANWAESKAVAVASQLAGENKPFAHTNFGAPGKIVMDKRVADLDIRTVRYANNVMLNLKKTDFEKGRVRISLRVGGGSLELPAQYEGLGIFMDSFFASGGTTQHSADELQSILAGRSVAGGLSVGTDAFEAYRATTPTDLEMQLQLLAAYLTSPGYRPEAEAQWRGAVGVFVPQLESQPGGVAARDVGRILASGDTRFGIPGEATLKARTFAELKPILSKSLASEPLELSIVGDIDEAQAMALVAKTFGALPPRAAKRPNYAKNIAVRFPAVRMPITLNHSGKADQGLVQVHWPTTDDTDFRHELTLDLLSEIMGLMATEELREKLGATYSPNASSSMSGTFKGYGYFSVSSTTEPKNIDTVLSAIDRMAASLSNAPISDDLIKRARTPMLERLTRNRRENGFWIGVTDEAQSDPGDLDDVRKWEGLLKSITAKDLQAAAKKYLSPAAALRIRIVPKAKG
jgi:zinc protease